ncbi:Uma2 family endonuclease [Sphingomonas sp. RHCKR47]|uniref:Uma2 family endonuclease n=1 Tax=Sphingomonas citricola TaxID=2862498 RepID=UPI001C66401F|nr:Uma2 family endonuclease [Sphingomonas citricola]MBW6523823.1 Uma2 family endonuclease [Sphingomonas citricola]
MTEHVPITNVPTRVKLRVEDFLSLDRDGAFDGYGKTELIDGEVTYMNAQHRPHALAKMALYDALRDGLRAACSTLHVMVEASVTWAPVDVPEPDLLLTAEPHGPGPVPGTSVSLVVEIADATLQSDLGRKAALYARHGVPEYWVIDVNGRTIHQLWSPMNGGYGDHVRHEFGTVIAAATIANLTVETNHL